LRHFILIFTFGLLLFSAANAQPGIRPAEKPKTLYMDTVKKKGIYFSTPFMDSMRNDSLRMQLAEKLQIHPPTVKHGKIVDPYDPFLKENYIRRGLGKFWFFITIILVLGLLVYFRNAFPNQMQLRLSSLFNSYHFRELIAYSGLTFTSGSVVAGIISTMVLAQAAVVIVVYSGYTSLNSIVFYILMLLAILVWRVAIYFLQILESFILNISALARSQTQRQINIDLGFSLLLFPFVGMAYYNSSLLANVNVALVVAITVTVWISVRICIEFLGIIRESGISLSGILYFCAFEILPHAVLITALFRIYSNT